MDLSGLYCETIKNLKSEGIPDIFVTNLTKEEFEKKINFINEKIKQSFESNDEDIEDLGDIVILIHMTCTNIIKNEHYSDDQILKIISSRMFAKKQMKYKMREARDKGRKFWQSDDAEYQYQEHLQHFWKDCVVELREIIEKYRKNFISSI